MSYWRQTSKQIIQSVIDQNRGLNNKELRKKISAAYPFGERQYHPYKIWCDEVHCQLGTKTPKPKKETEPKKAFKLWVKEQQELF